MEIVDGDVEFFQVAGAKEQKLLQRMSGKVYAVIDALWGCGGVRWFDKFSQNPHIRR